MRTQEMSDPARLRINHEQRCEGNEIEQITTSPAQDQRRDEQHEQVAVRGQAEPEQPDRERQGSDETARRDQRRSAIQVLARWAPFLGGLAVALAVLVRLPFWKAPLTADEGGYAEVARLWSHGAVLSLLCFCAYLDGRRRGWPRSRLLLSLAGAGALTGIAVLIKQSAFDAGLAAVVFLLWRERKRGLVPAAVLVGSALVPVAIAAASAARLNDWLYAVFGYRFDGGSIV